MRRFPCDLFFPPENCPVFRFNIAHLFPSYLSRLPPGTVRYDNCKQEEEKGDSNGRLGNDQNPAGQEPEVESTRDRQTRRHQPPHRQERASEDRLGLDIVYLQAKRWDGSVGRPEIQKFVGALHGTRAKKGVFITSGSFSSDALAYVEHIDPKVVLIDGRRLAELMIDFEVGVTTARTFHVKRVDSDYFEEG